MLSKINQINLNQKVLIFLGAFFFVIDRLAKVVVVESVVNRGVAFGVEVELGVQVVVWVVVLLGLIRWWWEGEPLLFPAILAIFSNLIDRIARGGVVDYLQLFGLWFNLADIVIVSTAAILIFKLYAKDRRKLRG